MVCMQGYGLKISQYDINKMLNKELTYKVRLIKRQTALNSNKTCKNLNF